MGAPSSSSVAKARCSPTPQSNASEGGPSPSLRRCSSSRAIFSWGVKPSGTCEIFSSSSRSFASGTCVATSGVCASGPPRYFFHSPAMAEKLRRAPSLRVRSSSVSRRAMRSFISCSASPLVATPSSASLRA